MKTDRIQIHSSIKAHWLWDKDRKFSKAEAWIDLLMSASELSYVEKIGNYTFVIKRGQQLVTKTTLSVRWNWPREHVVIFLDRLADDSMIIMHRDKQAMIIEICDFESYKPKPVFEPKKRRQK